MPKLKQVTIGASSRAKPVGVLLLLLAPTPLEIHAAEITVDGACTLVDAIEAANTDSAVGGCSAGSRGDTLKLSGDVILTSAAEDVQGPNGLPSVTSKITVEGNEHTVERLAASEFRIFRVAESGDLTLRNMTVAGGVTAAVYYVESYGGNVLIDAGRLTLLNTTITRGYGRGRGGGIYNMGGDATLFDSTVVGNKTYRSGAGIASSGTLRLRDSTVEFNDGSYFGCCGGIDNSGDAYIVGSLIRGNYAFGASGIGNSSGYMRLENSTVSGNRNVFPDIDGGIGNSGGVLVLESSTIAGNDGVALSSFSFATSYLRGSLLESDLDAPLCEGLGGVVDLGGNLAEDTSCGTIPDGLIGLNVLGDNGGPTQTHALLDISNAIDLSGTCLQTVDQRGVARPAGACDSGAFEYQDCPIVEIEDETFVDDQLFEACTSAFVGPAVEVDGPSGGLTIHAGLIVALRNGFVVDNGASLNIGLEPSLVP